VLISDDGVRWGWPVGRPQGEETWEQTFRREVLEEACVVVVCESRFRKGISIRTLDGKIQQINYYEAAKDTHLCPSYYSGPKRFCEILVDFLRPDESAPKAHKSQRRPPETVSLSPVTHSASSEARKTATRAISSGWPNRPSGVFDTISFSKSLPMIPA
jgi:hypothetical protein